MTNCEPGPDDDVECSARWPVQSGGTCDRCAAEIQAIIGGAIKRIEPRDTERLGASTWDRKGRWHGMSIRAHKEQFLYEDDIDFDF